MLFFRLILRYLVILVYKLLQRNWIHVYGSKSNV